VTITDTANGYLRRVRAELADLPAYELEEVMDDITAHLTELSQELRTPELLEARLGTPQQYAAQLRAAAGYPPRASNSGPADRGTAALGWLAVSTVLTPALLIAWFARDLDSSPAVFGWLAAGLLPAILGLLALRNHDPSVVASTPVWIRYEQRLHRLHSALPAGLRRDLVAIGQPVWWVLRGAMAGVALCGVIARTTEAGPLLAAALVGVLVSIKLGRLSQSDRRWLWLLVPLNAVAVLAVAILLIGGTSAWGWDGYSFDGAHRNLY
jgi:hypothetical protein